MALAPIAPALAIGVGAAATVTTGITEVANILPKFGENYGKMGTYVENPGVKIEWSQFAQHAWERMEERGMTREIVKRLYGD